MIRLYEVELGLSAPEAPEMARFLSLLAQRRAHTVAVALFKGLVMLLAKDSGTSTISLRARLAVARRLVLKLGTMKGFGTKLAQMVHNFAFALPESERAAFLTLPSPSPAPGAQVADIITAELGRPPRQIFATWRSVPFATASLGQVHRAKLSSGDEVAVKVQYPKIVTALRRDMDRMAMLDEAAALLFRAQAPHILTGAIRDHLVNECDYRLEAKHQTHFATIFSDRTDLVIPRLYLDLSSERILTTQFMHGAPLADWSEHASQRERNRIALVLCRFVLEGIFNHATMLGDPHPGNFLVRGDALVVLDFGRVFLFDRAFIDEWRALIAALLARDHETVDMLMRAWGVAATQRFDFVANRRMLDSLFEPFIEDRDFTFDGAFLRRQWRAAWSDNPNRFRMSFSINLASLHEFHFGWLAILARLGARANWHRVIMPYILTSP
jgi:predicted unusual protein kinase regulating ubiquinone biosynthesis (AarF/ABC1/UbiB family)